MKFVKTHYASIGLIVLGIGQLLTGDTNTGAHSILLGLAAFGIHGADPVIFGEGNDGDTHGKTFGDWLVQVATLGSPKTSLQAKAAAQDRIEKVYSSEYNAWQKAAMAESSGTTGGYTVPPDFYQQLLAIAAEENTFRQYPRFPKVY